MMPGVSPALFTGMQYRLVGPPRGGRVTTVTGVPSQPRTFYMGVASGGVFKTTDGGANWMPITDGKVPLGSMGAIAVATSDPERRLLGTGRTACAATSRPAAASTSPPTPGRRGSSPASTTPGRSAPCASTRPIRTSSGSRRTATSSRPNAERGVFKTTDGGTTWRKMLFLSRAARRDGRRAPARQSERRLRVDVAHRAQAVDDHQRLARGRLLQEHGRRRDVHEDRRRACRTS